jgi:hypothetical protein
MTADAGAAGARGERLRRAAAVRAFEDKQGGWTLLTADGGAFRLANPASLCLWEALETGATRDELLARLVRRFPGVPQSRLEGDAVAFLAQLEAHGFLEVVSGQGDAGRRRRGPPPPG